MANRVTEEDIIHMNEEYLKCGTYTGVARRTGFSPSTVRKYIKNDYIPGAQRINLKDSQVHQMNIEENIEFLLRTSHLSKLSSDELKDLKEVWKSMAV